MHDCCQPLVETGLAKHGFLPLRCGLLALPTVCRKEGSHVTFQKTSPCKPLLGGVDMSPPCRLAQPTSRHDPGGWQPPAPPRQDRPGPLPPARPPRPLGAAGAAGPHGVWAADDNGHRDDQRAVAHHPPQPQAIDPQPDPRCLAALPGAHPPPWLASLLEHTVVSRPRPLPPTLGRGALSRHLPPQPAQEGLASTRQRPAPLLLGPCPQEAARDMLSPNPPLRQLVARSTSEPRGKPPPKDGSPPLHWGLQRPFDLGPQGLRQPPFAPRLFQGLQAALGSPWRSLQPRAVLPEATWLGMILPSLRAGHRGHGRRLSCGVGWVWRRPWPKVYVLSSTFMPGFADAPC